MDQNKSLRGVAEAVTRIMMGEKALHPNQQKLDVHEPEKDKLTAKDFEMLRNKKKMKEETESVEEGIMDKVKGILGKKEKSSNLFDQPHVKKDTAEYLKKSAKQPQGPNNVTNIMTKEEVEELDEGKVGQLAADLKDLSHDEFTKEYGKPKHHYDPTVFKKPVQKGKEMDRAKSLAQRGMASMKKEEVEELDEMFPGTPEYEKKYGKVPQDMKKGEKKKTSQGEMEKTEKGVVHKRKFSEMLDVYANGNLKSLFEALDEKEEIIVEEPTNDEFKAELKKAIDKSLGKDKAKVADPAVQAVEVQKEEVELEERSLSEPEMKKKEEIVKSMKKNLQGFKDRYGDRAKEVMYATATKQAMKEESESEHYKAGHEHGADSALDAGFKVTARARKKDMLANNPHKKGTPEHSDWHRGANDGHQMALDNM